MIANARVEMRAAAPHPAAFLLPARIKLDPSMSMNAGSVIAQRTAKVPFVVVFPVGVGVF
jgi:hypothetical protein